MNLSGFNFLIVFATYSICGPPSCSAEWSKNDTENLRALYHRLRKRPDNSFLDRLNLRVANEDLKSRTDNSSDDVKIMLYEHGYLKVEKRDELYTTLYFKHNSDLRLYAHLVWIAHVEDHTCRKAISKIKSFLERIPPETDDFKSFMLALDTVLGRIPHLFQDWGVQAVFGTLYVCGLKLKVGRSPIDFRCIYCEDFANNTIMRFLVLEHNRNATRAWDSYYRDLLLPGLLDSPKKNLLAMVVTLIPEYENSNSTIRDWYGVFETPERDVLREYRPGISTCSPRAPHHDY